MNRSWMVFLVSLLLCGYSALAGAQDLEVTITPRNPDEADKPLDFDDVIVPLPGGAMIRFSDYIRLSVQKSDLESARTQTQIWLETGVIAENLDRDWEAEWARLSTEHTTITAEQRSWDRGYPTGQGLLLASTTLPASPGFSIGIGNNANLGLTETGDIDTSVNFAYHRYDKGYALADELCGCDTVYMYAYLPHRKYGFEQ